MDSILYERIKMLCQRKGISISKLESELGFGSSSIRKWGITNSPSIDKVNKVAGFFNVSTDYLIGRTDIEGTASDILGDKYIISLQRAKQKMPPKDQENMLKMIKLGYAYAFPDEDDEDNNGDDR